MKNTYFLKNNLIAHRGYHDIKKGIPENSIAAFKRAIRYNYIIELDVHLTKDNKIVVFHDYSLKRMCKIDKLIEDCSYNELLKYNLLDTKYKIPLLDEVLRLIDGKVGLLIETKNSSNNTKLELLLSEKLDNYKGDFAIQSFYPLSILWFKKNKKNYIRGILSSDFKKHKDMSNLKKNILKCLVFDIFLKSDFIAYDIKALPNSYVESKRKNKLILSWNIKNAKDYNKALEYSDNIIGENMKDYI